jgi:hypothetical protein
VAALFLCGAGNFVGARTLQPLNTFDVSAALGLDPSQHARIFVTGCSSGLIAVQLGREVHAIEADFTGSELFRFPSFSETSASRAFLADDGLLWIFGVNRSDRTAYASAYDLSGHKIGTFPAGKGVPRAAVGSRLVSTSMDGLLHLLNKNGGAYVEGRSVDLHVPLHSIIVPLSPTRLAVVAQSSGDLSIADLDAGTGTTVSIKSPAIQREISNFRAGGNTDPKVELIAVAGANRDEQGYLFYVLGSVFPGEGATVPG